MTYLEIPDFPKAPDRGSHNIPLGPLLYIERSDFVEGDQKGFRRLTPNQPVGLKYTSSTISVQNVVKVGVIWNQCTFSADAFSWHFEGYEWEGGGDSRGPGEADRHMQETSSLHSLGCPPPPL